MPLDSACHNSVQIASHSPQTTVKGLLFRRFCCLRSAVCLYRMCCLNIKKKEKNILQHFFLPAHRTSPCRLNATSSDLASVCARQSLQPLRIPTGSPVYVAPPAVMCHFAAGCSVQWPGWTLRRKHRHPDVCRTCDALPEGKSLLPDARAVLPERSACGLPGMWDKCLHLGLLCRSRHRCRLPDTRRSGRSPAHCRSGRIAVSGP